MTFVHGELFEYTLQTTHGAVDILAETVIVDKTLELRDITIYPQAPMKLSGVNSGILAVKTVAVKTEVKANAKAQGFDYLRLTAKRLQSSSSALPGKTIDILIDLTK
ncbi:MAG: hypothetical protein IAF08_02045 [Rhizobacter sp.]|nr:hypothetical protein [Chlorobiales bacterium]